MKFLLDTNITIHQVRKSPFYYQLEEKYQFKNEDNQVVMCSVSVGELLSLSIQPNWGEKKKEWLELLIERIDFISIFDRKIYDAYAQIDAYSQSKHPTVLLPKGMTARNMGKNDIWIAATAHAIGADLVTTDKDFDHLDGVFLNVINA